MTEKKQRRPRTPAHLMVNVDTAMVKDILGRKHLTVQDLGNYTGNDWKNLNVLLSRGRMSLIVINNFRDMTGVDLAPAIYIPVDEDRMNGKQDFVRSLDTGQILTAIEDSTEKIVDAINRLLSILE